MNEISIGSRVETTDGKYKAVVLPCPTNLKVYKSGKGFKAGDIFSLKSQLGRGCVIKVTKVDSEGAIKNIKVIRFGLDYKTKFYSYLSSKELGAWEYIHPLALNHQYNADEPHYNENSGGFIDSGWATKQTYFYYDPEIPVNPDLDPARASDRFFADPAYVGEVVEQFYADDSKKPIDEDLAIIEIDLGAVAKYPGYYMKADGFVSDEVFIQDGNYYQAFSYVVRVEEELRKYSDIVKALVHPSGMKIFSEYRIFNILEVAAVTRKAMSVLQLPLPDHPASVGRAIDRGFAYNNYITEALTPEFDITQPSTIINAGYVTYPDPIPDLEGPGSSGIIDSRQGKASKHLGKYLADVLAKYPETRSLLVEKPVFDFVNELDLQSKHFTKNVSDSISQYVESVVKSYVKNIADPVSQPDSLSKFFETLKTDIQLVVDSYSLHVSKPINDIISSIVDSNVKLIEKAHIESIQAIDNRISEYIKSTSEALMLIEFQAKELVKPIDDYVTSGDDYNKAFAKNLDEVIVNIENLSKIVDKSMIETILNTESIEKSFERQFSDYSTQLDSTAIENIRSYDEALSVLDSYISVFSKSISDIQVLLDSLTNDITKGDIAEVVSILDVLSNSVSRIFEDSVNIYDELLLTRSVLVDDMLYVFDLASNASTKNLAETQAISDYGLLRSSESTKYELINISMMGRLRLEPYDQESYFAVFEDYQPAVSIQ